MEKINLNHLVIECDNAEEIKKAVYFFTKYKKNINNEGFFYKLLNGEYKGFKINKLISFFKSDCIHTGNYGNLFIYGNLFLKDNIAGFFDMLHYKKWTNDSNGIKISCKNLHKYKFFVPKEPKWKKYWKE